MRYGSNIVPIMTSNTLPSGIASASSVNSTGFEAFRAFDRSSTTVWATSSSSTGWIQYQFPSKVRIGKYTITNHSTVTEAPRNWDFQGSNNGSQWVTLDTRLSQTNWGAYEKREFTVSNPDLYIYYRLNITQNNGSAVIYINEMELIEALFDTKHIFESTNGEILTFYSPDNSKSSIPIMTSAILPSGKVTNSTSTQEGYYAFDGSSSVSHNGWLHTGTSNGWLAYEFPTPKTITRYTITPTYGGVTTYAPKDFVFQGSNDGGLTWDNLDAQLGVTSWVMFTKKTFIIKNIKPYKMYRIYCFSNNGGANYIHIGEMEMFEDFGELLLLQNSTPTLNDYNNYGMDSITINPVKINRKKYFTVNKQVLGNGNVYEKSINITDDKISSLIL